MRAVHPPATCDRAAVVFYRQFSYINTVAGLSAVGLLQMNTAWWSGVADVAQTVKALATPGITRMKQ
jgi:hypothetical protein